ncbi:MAG: tryptophan-rich sensory protein [Candidatus Eremiobacteraeota bacterium]|nr:tryptophan-rich sensory protein [Candidatus Eremiobacteraeota bacterium]
MEETLTPQVYPRVQKPRARKYGLVETLAAGIAMNVIANVLGPSDAAKTEYAKSTRPRFAPPSWAFGVAWPVNNLLTLWGNRRVLNAPPSPDRTAYIRLQAATWALFMSYGLVRFRLKSPILGYANTTMYLALTVASLSRAARIDRKLLLSFSTLIPWLLLATTLSVYQLNDADPLF